MTYKVEMTSRAQRDYTGLFLEINAQDSPTAVKWHHKLSKAILSLTEMPERCPAIRENARLKHLLYGRKPNVYRIIFRILEREKRVQVIHIRHAARRDFGGPRAR
jgi:toxin ParE1/3/4